MGRPRTYKEEARTQTITVRVTAGTRARLNEEAAQAGKSLAGLAEHYISRGSVVIESDAVRMHPATFAELKRVAADLKIISTAAPGALPPKSDQVASALHDLLQLIFQDELLSQRANALRARTANDSTPPSSRDEFQRVVHVRSSRSEDEDG